MKKIGFIDYYLDEWHALSYPAWIKEASGGEMEVAYAYAETASPHSGMTTEEWCERFGVKKTETIEELVKLSDGIVVLSPDNCERHEMLSKIPLESGKPVYIDKTFAPDYETAKRIFALAEANNTPCWSTSALRFADEYRALLGCDDITAMNFWGPNCFETYSIHQLEPLFMLMKAPAESVMYLPAENYYMAVFRFADGRAATVSSTIPDSPFAAQISKRSGNVNINVSSDFFRNFIKELVDFFNTGDIKVPHSETLNIMAARSAVIKAMDTPFEWVKL